MTNADIAAVFDQIADILEYQGAGIFRVRAYRTAARTIGNMIESLATIRADATRSLTDLEGIGTDLAGKIETLQNTGTLPLLEELQAAMPPAVFELMRVPGLGPKKVKLLIDELGVTSLDDLERACRDGSVQQIKGFGNKTQTIILKNIAFVDRESALASPRAQSHVVLFGACKILQGCPKGFIPDHSQIDLYVSGAPHAYQRHRW